MLYRIEIENYFSIRDRQILDMTIDQKVSDPEHRFAPIFKGSQIRAPKVIAIFGANASGKSTLLRAVAFLAQMIRDSVSITQDFIPNCERFNDTESANRPISFAIEFGSIMNLNDETERRCDDGEEVEYGIYRYELDLGVSNGKVSKIIKESLKQKPMGVGKWQRVYERDENGAVKDSKSFSMSGYHHLQKTLSEKHTVISSFAKFSHPSAQQFLRLAQKILTQIEPINNNPDFALINYLRNEPEVVADLNRDLNRLDVGIDKLEFKPTQNGPSLVFKHAGLEIDMPWDLQSHGTKAIIKMYPLISATLAVGGVLLIDEMDAAIHPMILPEFINWFYDTQRRNKDNAQLWLSCHSAALLDNLTAEEIVLCEKDAKGRTSIFSLMDVKIRRDDNHYKKYLSGVYGGVPQLG